MTGLVGCAGGIGGFFLAKALGVARPLEVGPGTRLGLRLAVRTPAQVGADRQGLGDGQAQRLRQLFWWWVTVLYK